MKPCNKLSDQLNGIKMRERTINLFEKMQKNTKSAERSEKHTTDKREEQSRMLGW